MVIDIINVQGVAVREAEYHAPVCSDRHRPETLPVAFERTQAKPRQAHILCRGGSIQPRENVTQLFDVLLDHAA